jgi:hypothetical protein
MGNDIETSETPYYAPFCFTILAKEWDFLMCLFAYLEGFASKHKTIT